MKRIALLGTLLCALVCGAALAGESFRPIDRDAARGLTDAKAYAAPTIVALWSSDCVHCKSNLALFARMAKAEARLRVITVAVEPASTELAAPLDRLAVPGTRFAYGPDAPEALAYALDSKWHGELPRTLFFDGRGGKAAVSGVVDEAKARQALGL
jgi:thiol-disulfide isomerase/thioredoxin